MSNRRCRVVGTPLRGRRLGGLYIEMLVCVCILLAVVATLIYIPPLYTQKQALDYMGQKLVRAAEVAGTTADLEGLETALADQLNLTPIITWDIPESSRVEGDADGAKVQLRGTFTVTLTDSFRVFLIDPVFSPPVAMEIPVSVTMTGVSEKFWR